MDSVPETDAQGSAAGVAGLVPIDEVARRLGLRASAIRYYEGRGLVWPSARRAGRRWYSPADIRRLAIIGHWQRVGQMSLDEIGEILAGPAATRGWAQIVQERIEALRLQAEQMNAAREHLEHVLSHHRDSPPDGCHHFESLIYQQVSVLLDGNTDQLAALARQQCAAQLAAVGLSQHQHAILCCLDEFGRACQKDIAARLGIDGGDIVAFVDGLQQAGLITRERDQRDRRRQMLALTTSGRRLLRRVERLMDAAEPGALAALAPEQRALLHACATEALAADAPRSWVPGERLAEVTP